MCMLSKLEAENSEVELETLLSLANMASNSLQRWNDFSSNQPVFGKNPNLTNIMQTELPALEGSTSSKTFHKHMNALHEACKAYIQSEADKRIRPASRSKARVSEQFFDNRDLVFYKQEGKDCWLRSGKVIFQDRKVVFVRHGGVFIKVSSNRLSGKFRINNLKLKEKTSSDKLHHENDKPGKEKKVTKISETIIRGHQGTEPCDKTELCSTKELGLKKDQIQYMLPGEEEWITATILGRTSKANKTWFNVKDHTTANEQKSLDLKTIKLKIFHWEDNKHVNLMENDMIFNHDIAKQNELQRLSDFGTYDEVKNHGQKTISTRWVITSKEGTTKVHLIAKGFQGKLSWQIAWQ